MVATKLSYEKRSRAGSGRADKTQKVNQKELNEKREREGGEGNVRDEK
jgi:hypothetical protein